MSNMTKATILSYANQNTPVMYFGTSIHNNIVWREKKLKTQKKPQNANYKLHIIWAQYNKSSS